MCVQTSRSSEEAFRFFGKNFLNLGRSLPIFGRSLPVCCGVVPQTHFGKVFRIAASIFKTCTITKLDHIQHGLCYIRLQLSLQDVNLVGIEGCNNKQGSELKNSDLKACCLNSAEKAALQLLAEAEHCHKHKMTEFHSGS